MCDSQINNYISTLLRSHKKRKYSLETRAVLIEISMLCWNLPSGPKHWGSLQKQVIFVLIWMKQTLILFNLQRDGTGNGFSNIKDTSVESVQLQMSVLHQSLCIFKAGLFQVHLMTGQNIRKKYLMCQIPIKTLKQHAIPNSSLHNLKIYSSKWCRKTSLRWIIPYMYLANTAILNIRISSMLKISLQIMDFCFDWWILSLLTMTSITQCITK